VNDKPQPRDIPKERIDAWIAEDESAAAKLGLKTQAQDVTGHPAFGTQKGEKTPVDEVVRKLREGRKLP
jgi:hypothetical protein